MLLSYTLTEQITQKLRELNKRLAEKYVILKNLPSDERDLIHKWVRVSMIGASTRIENALLTDQEIEWIDTLLTKDGRTTNYEVAHEVIKNKLSKDRERSIEEVAGCRAMILLIYSQAKDFFPLTEKDLRGLHYELMHYYKEAVHYAGRYKTQPNYVVEYNKLSKLTKVIFKTADAGPITDSAMSDLIKWYNIAMSHEIYTLPVTCEFIFRFLAIHPFQDGNGRLGRGLFLLSLLQSSDELLSYITPFLAIDRHIEKHKAEYYTILNKCSKGNYKNDPKEYEIQYFLNFMIKIINESLNDINFYQKKIIDLKELSKSKEEVLLCFKENPELRLNTDIICKQTNIPRRTVINALNTLLEKGFIQKYGKGSAIKYQLTF